MLTLLLPLLAYLAGSVSSAVIVCRIMDLPDPRSSGSNNPGATNVLRLGGKKKGKLAAGLTLFGDILKGFIPVFLAQLITDKSTTIALVGLGAFVGHLYPVFFGFKGGKGVATAAGVFFAISSFVSLMLLAIWLVAAFASNYSSLAALITSVLLPILVIMFIGQVPIILLAVAITGLLFWRHRDNIARLRKGEESKIGLFGG